MTGRKSLDQLSADLKRYRDHIGLNSDWTHLKSGDPYTVVDVGYRESTMEIVVIYTPAASDVVFVRSYQEFLLKFKSAN